MSDNKKFGFEDLEVWRKALNFADKVLQLADKIEMDRKHFHMVEQLELCVTSIPMSIAEGKGTHSKKEFDELLHIARGSLYETIALLMIFRRKGWIEEIHLKELKEIGGEVEKEISSLIKSLKDSKN